MKIAIGADHRGYLYKKQIMEAFSCVEWVDIGCDSEARCDFPLYVKKLAAQLYNETADRGILLCGSGVGMSIAANRFKGVYAALSWNPEVAKLSRQHNNSNVLVLPADFISFSMAQEIISTWFETDFLGSRYQERITMLNSLG